MSEMINTYRYHGTAAQFAADLDRLKVSHGKRWTSLSWDIHSRQPGQLVIGVMEFRESAETNGHGVILATEKESHTLIEFYDDHLAERMTNDFFPWIECAPIGPAFKAFSDFIKVQFLRDEADAALHDCPIVSLPTVLALTGKPEAPPRDAKPDYWIDWFYRVREGKYRITVADLAKTWGLSETRVYAWKAEYVEQYGKCSMAKSVENRE